MKLSQLAITERSKNDAAIYALLGHLPVSARQYDNESVYYHFVDLVVQNKLLSEAGMSGLESILQAGVARLKAALTPHSGQDLDALLSFMAPERGGSKAIAGLLDSAKTTNEPLVSSDDWWDNLYATLNITDAKTQEDIRTRVASEFNMQMPGAVDSSTAASARQKVRSQLGHDSYADALKKERQQSGQYADQLRQTIDMGRQARTQASNKLTDLNGQLSSLMGQMSKTESVFGPIAAQLVEDHNVQKHLRPILMQLMDRMYSTPPVISEAGLLDRARTFAANPNFAKSEVNRFTSSQDNLRAAKLAIQLATQHLRTEFSSTLTNAGLSPDEVIKIYQQWKKLRTSGGNQGQIATLQQKLQQAYALFTIKSGGGQSDLGVGDTSTQSDADQIAGATSPVNAALGQGQTPAKFNPPPINGGQQPQPQPGQPKLGADGRKPFAKALAQKMVIAASAAAERGQDPLAAAKAVAQRAARVDMETASIVWRMFKARYRG